MKAAVYYGKKDIRVTDVPIREVGKDDVLIRVKYCGVCGTDIHIYNGDGGSSEVVPPLIPGHEFSGIIESVGDEVTKFKKGDRVSVDPNSLCGECYFCRNAMPHFCEDHIGIGTTLDGAFSEYITVPASMVYRISNQISFLEAAMAEPLSCCLHGLDLCEIQSGDTVLIIGGGPIGMIMLQLARHAGAGQLILSEPVPEKREMAVRLGADLVIDPVNENLQEVLSQKCKNVDKVIECVGSVKLIEQALECAGKGATVMMFGLAAPGESLPLKPDMVFKKELKITSSYVNPYTFERALKLLENHRIDVTGIISEIIDLDHISEAFTNPELRKKGKLVVKVDED
ncbi:MAG: zinc-dependent alcohol dehydrogenase family protein [Lachnospiraceae bacterium]|nr:zinc-dependent alcohol dehydrogenase family protein [Lachnospiraceae bacterium]